MSWDSYEERVKRGPMSAFMLIFGSILIISVIVGGTGYIFGWFGEAAQVAQEEFGPKKALEKYEWFINRANDIEKMDQDVVLFDQRLTGVDAKYDGYGDNQADWPPHIQVQYNTEQQQARDDLLAIKSQRNGLVREYNASSEKFNWKLFQTSPDKPKERFHEML